MPEFEWQFTLVLLTNGVMIGLMYALIALGFVLIYKATDAINFAQGEFVMFAGFIAAGAADAAGSADRCGRQHCLPRRVQLVLPQKPHRHRDACRRRQPASGVGDGDRRAP